MAGKDQSAVQHPGPAIGQAGQAITEDATQAQTRHQHVVQLATTHFAQATPQATDKLGAGVDQATARNEAHVGGQVTTGMASAAAQVGADHDKSLLDKVVDFFKSAWDWVSSVAEAVASVVVDFLVFASGAILQIVSDSLFGLLDPLLDRIGSDEFQRGRDAGDKIALILAGAALIIGGIAALGGGLVISVVEIAGTGGLAIPVVIVQDGALVTVGVGAITAGILLMASSGTPGNNQAQNRQFRAAVQEGEREIGRKLSKDEIRRVHDEISGNNYSYQEIVQLIVDMFG